MYRWVLIIWALLCFPFVNAEAQNISNEGTDFWAVFPTHDPSRNNNGTVNLANVRIYITTKTSSEVTVTCGSFNSGPVNIPGNTAVWVDVPRADSYIIVGDANSIIANKGIHVQVTPGRDKVAVFEHIYAGARSAASLILPREALGREYYSMNYIQDVSNGEVNRNFLVLVAADANTTLIVHKKDGSSFKVDFANAGDVYEYAPPNQEDLTGMYVEVDKTSPDNCNKRFAAYSGSTSLKIACNGSRDPLFQQLYPTGSWGKSYGVVPFINRRHIIRILAQEDNTTVQFEGNVIPLNKGDFYTSGELTNSALVTADKRISVAQYSLTQACSSAGGTEIFGDPEMVLLNPIEFNVKSTTLFSSDKERITERYINVLIKTSATSTFKIDGTPVNTMWTPVPSNPEYSFTQIQINAASSYLTANEGFNAIAYGFGDHESYAYSAGTNLAATTYFLVTNKITQRDAQNACVGQESDFKIILPYLVAKITWKLDDGPEEPGSLDHVIIPAADGTLTYEYKFGRSETFTELRSHRITIKIELPNDGTGCLSGEAEFSYTFDVYPLPTVDFQFPNENCADTEIQFTDAGLSNIPGKPLNKWLWDFGDGTFSTEQNPKHIFSASGPFVVKLSVGLDEGCMSDVLPKTITIGPKITTGFAAGLVGCINKPHTFEDKSIVEAGATIVKWHWDFGDNTPIPTDQTLSVVQHTYTSLGKFKVTLVTESATGCVSLLYSKEITITALPIPKFILPKICSSDNIAEFKNLSVDGDGTTASLASYLWDFGDVGSVGNASNAVDGTHKYNQPGLYTVKLTVTNANGCSDFITSDFTVNGPDVEAKFDVVNKDNLCSNKKVEIINTSTVHSVGTVIKLRIYFDAVNKPGEFIEDDDPVLNESYEHTYPAMITADPKPFTIKMVAYSGESCSNTYPQVILLNPSPIISFNNIPAVCINVGKIQLTQASETLGIAGDSKYTGLGITEDGWFDPSVAGVGRHDITYTFTAHNGGCEESLTKPIVVDPIPIVTLPSDLYILEGGEKQIDVSVSSSGNTYEWSPSEGISRNNVLSPTFFATSDRVYTLTVTTATGCSTSERVFVHVIKSIEPTNAFSPNGDGVNDVWVIKYIETYVAATVDIFNRYGEKVFFSQGYSIPFDGNYQGIQLPVGTYYYIINPKNGKKTITGSLTLIR
ncbi:PKD domain-containing protein [Pedobacter hiemivivus]|uniref:PKD domain-containing protein n=1 Tax=Pedobacter hiemivivus TaxID=2530454 RepID=A0A4R0N931_9SPHI|nr:PKD domain-containing protein [Pedobacter hiemivivus]